MTDRAHLVLADGTVYTGHPIGAAVEALGEVVFNTSMTGYQEVLTDPSYAGQIVTMTFPLIGNYGINAFDDESRQLQVRGFVVRQECPVPSRWQMESTLDDHLREHGVPGVAGIDTRALTRKLRSAGVMMGIVTSRRPEEALEVLRASPPYGAEDYVLGVTAPATYEQPAAGEERFHLALLDVGVKYNIQRSFHLRGCRTTTLPATASAEDVLAVGADGLVVSPGPGDPERLDYVVRSLEGLVGKTPIMGICLGHQALAKVFGGTTYKLKYGHRGANHPVFDRATNQVHITSQNHGFAVDPDRLAADVEVAQVHLDDGTVEGLTHRREPVLTIQYHSEASPGPHDNMYLFDRFLDMVAAAKGS
jgi:carbamoyl-phosphate synthase small subunit